MAVVLFAPLQVISANSLLKSTLRIEDYVKRAADLGYQSLVLSDIDVMYGVLDFYHACQKYQIKPIFGLTLEFESDAKLLLIAKNNTGYHNLLKLSSLKMTTFKQELPDLEEFLKAVMTYSQDLFIISPAKESLLLKYYEQAGAILERLKQTKTAGIYLGIDPLLSKQELLAIKLLAQQTQTALIAASAVHYLEPADYFEVKVLRAIGKAEKLGGGWNKKNTLGKNYLKEIRQYHEEYQNLGLKKALDENARLCDLAQVTLAFPKTKLPHFKTPNGLSAKVYLQKLCQEGLRQRLIADQITETKPYFDRLKQELAVIDAMGFDDYFLIVWDVTNYAHNNQIRIGPGRGSAAGSLVSYVLKITDVDPLRYGLLFERFLNPERAQMPDIDLDIPDAKRDQIIKYVHQKYGHEHMAQIITFGTLGARQAIRDVARVMGLTSFEIDEWSKALPHKFKLTLKEAYQESQKVKNLIADSQRNEVLFKTALKLEGLPRHYSTHAAGVILSDEVLSDLIPVQLGTDQILLSQFAKDQVEEAGLLKIDFLGLRNLTILDNALKFVRNGYQEKLDLKQLSLDDPLTLRLFQAGQTNGVFQFESTGIKNVLRRLHPTSFEDVAAVNALYRPGPIGNIDEFIARKHGKHPVSYPEKSLRPILAKTYGIMVYQEQVMQVASAMGGFSLGEADLLRRAISKKDQLKIDKLQARFVMGAEKKGYTVASALEVYEYMQRFGNYGFNRSHAVAYSKMAFELAYLKSHYPAAFFAALLNSVIGNDNKLKEYLGEMRQFKLQVAGPDINTSQLYFSLKSKKVVFGLGSIKTLRGDLVKAILQERRQNGNFKSLADLIRRLDKKLLKEEQLKALIYAGALDQIESDRSKLLSQLPMVLSNIALSGENQTLFEMLAPKEEKSAEKLSTAELLEKEFYYLGTYLSGHPVEKYAWLRQRQHTKLLAKLIPNENIKTVVYVKNKRVIRTKKGEQMAFLQVADESGETELVIFPREYRRFATLCEPQNILLVSGKVEVRNERKSILVSDMVAATDIKEQYYYLRLERSLAEKTRQQLWQILRAHHGDVPVIIIEENENRKIILQENLWLRPDESTKEALTTLLGSKNVVLK